MTDSFIGRTLGKYQVEEKLGQGGMGKVYRGRQISLNRPVAIKVLPAQMAMDPEFVQRFQQEARVIASLQHENIVHIYDIDETRNADGDAIYFIVMELVDGHNLSQRAGAGRPMSEEHVKTIGVALARALDYAHRQGIVHRDIKGANVMVTREGQVKLMDFGIAKSAGGVKTATGSVLGTPEYMAPEQARSGQVTSRTDIYSLGVLLFELATGRLPFTGQDPFAVALKHISEAPPRPRDLEASISPQLEAVILRTLEKDPAHRFESAAELAEALDALGGGVDTRLPPALAAGATLPLTPTPARSPATGDEAPTRVTPGAMPSPPPGNPPPGDPTGAGTPPEPPADAKRPPAVLTALAVLAIAAMAAVAWLLIERPATSPPPSELPAAESQAQAQADDAVQGAVRAAVLAAAREHFEAGRLEEADQTLAQALEADPDDAEALELKRQIDAAARQVEALGIVAEAREGGLQPAEDPGTADAGTSSARALDSRAREGSRDVAPSPAPPPAPAEPRRSPAQLRAEAERLKDQKRYHSLKTTLDAWIATGSATSEAHTWRGKVDGWIDDEEDDLRDELEDLLDDLADAVEDRDESDLVELWDHRIDTPSRNYFRQLWRRYDKVELEYEVESSRAFDRHIDFVARVTVMAREGRRGRLKPVSTKRWRGRLVDEDDPIFTSPFGG